MAAWLKEDNQDILAKTILFLISPFFAFLYSLRRIKTKSSYVIFFLFAVFFGMAFTVSIGKSIEYPIDGAAYREMFELMKYTSFDQYFNGFKNFFKFHEDYKDYYFDTVAFYISRITNNYHVLFMIFAMIFAYFSLKSFKFLTSEDNFRTSLICFILAYLFMYNQIFNINGVRFNTANWIGIYAIFQIFRNKDKQYWLLVFMTPFFHGSFWVFIGVLLLAEFTRKFEKLWIVLFIISFFISDLAIEIIKLSTNYLPTALANMAESYTTDSMVAHWNEMGEGYGWISYVFRILTKLYISLFIFLFIKNSKLIRSNYKTESIYLFLLVWVTFFNFFSFIPSLGGRYISFVWPLIAYIWLVIFKNIKYKKVLYIMPFIFLWNFYTFSVYYLKVLSLDFFISNPLYLIYKYLI